MKFHENRSSGSRAVACGRTWRSLQSLVAILLRQAPKVQQTQRYNSHWHTLGVL